MQVFDSWAGELAPHHFREFALPALKHIASSVRAKLEAQNIAPVPMTLFPKGADTLLAELAEHSGYDVLGIDWCIDAADARKIVGNIVALQGNLDPNVLYGGQEAIEREVKRMCAQFRDGKAPKGWIANLGHGITPGVDPEDLRFFLECVHKYSKA